jgi:hypothetical protein
MAYRRGWFAENYRHYLASKGIKTNRYYAKGNYAPAGVKRAHALRLTDAETLARAPELQSKGIIGSSDVSWLRRNLAEKTPLSSVIQPTGIGIETGPSVVPTLAESASFSSLPTQEVPLAESPSFEPMQTSTPGTVGADEGGDGIAPITTEGFEESEPLGSAEISTAAQTPGVPEVPAYGLTDVTSNQQ